MAKMPESLIRLFLPTIEAAQGEQPSSRDQEGPPQQHPPLLPTRVGEKVSAKADSFRL